jgi:hypothetical protein
MQTKTEQTLTEQIHIHRQNRHSQRERHRYTKREREREANTHRDSKRQAETGIDSQREREKKNRRTDIQT